MMGRQFIHYRTVASKTLERPSKENGAISSKIYIFVAVQFLRNIALPISWGYGLIVRIRNYAFDKQWFRSKTFKTPIICVGNLSVGGTGKTPMIEFLVQGLQDAYRIAVLSRGYKRKSKGFVLATKESTVLDLGDEPYQIYRKFPELTVAVDADRQNGIANLESSVTPDMILLDDAYQHRKVKAGLYILLTAYEKLYIDDQYLPTGDLRDSRREARRAHLIIVTKCPPDLSSEDRERLRKRLKPQAHQQVLFSYLDYDDQLIGAQGKEPLSFFDDETTLVTGIANPKPLLRYLKEKGLTYEHLAFGDHHFFTEKELQKLNEKEKIITTEKDYVRLAGKVKNVYYISVRHRFFEEEGAMLITEVHRFMKRYS